MKIVIGLGNPGRAYEWTRHNLGFLAADALAERAAIRIRRPECASETGIGRFAGEEVLLAKPQTMMNLSGSAAQSLLQKYECRPADMIVLYDDVDLPLGMIRVRPHGSAGTHNGMRSIVETLGTTEFPRVRIGIAPESTEGQDRAIHGELRDYVLGRMTSREREVALEVAGEAAEAVELIVTEGVERAMQRFNRRKPAEDARNDE